MSQSDSVAETLRRRANRHALEDGMADLCAGVYTLIVGGATQRIALIALAAAYLMIMGTGWKFAHEAVCARRTGAAEPVDQPQMALLTGILGAGVGSLLVVAASTFAAGRLWDLAHWPLWVPVLAGLVLAAGFGYTYVRSGLTRWAVYATAAAVGGFAFWLAPFSDWINPSDRLTLLLFSVAGLLLAGGTATLVRFVRRHPVVPEEARHGA
jgi:hypothetical protein